jgi:hypothetical protein
MRKDIEIRVIKHANLFLERDMNIRSVSEKTGWARQTVFMDLTIRLQQINTALYNKIQEKFRKNKYLGQIKGGLTTQEKLLNNKLRREKYHENKNEGFSG